MLNFFLFFLIVVQNSSISYCDSDRLCSSVWLTFSACSDRSSKSVPMVSRWWPVMRSMDRIPFRSTKSLHILMISSSDRCLWNRGVDLVSEKVVLQWRHL